MLLPMKLHSCIAIVALTFAGGCVEHCNGGGPAPAVDAASGPDGSATGPYVLDPDTLIFYGLPIGSVRYAVSGLEPTSGQCVTLVWFINELTTGDYHLCGPDPAPTSAPPYAIIAPPTPPDPPSGDLQYGAQLCEVWSYGPNATVVDDVVGCVDFTDGPPATGSVDLVVTLDDPALTGEVVIRSP